MPGYIPLVFLLTAALTVFLFWQACGRSRTFLLLILGWCSVQSLVSLTGFYTQTNSIPPRFVLLVGPILFTVILLFFLPKGRAWVDTFDLQRLTLLHSVRFPVELVLMWLSTQKLVPELMTFEGLNFDILSGITAAPLVYLVFLRKKAGRKLLLAWNFICLVLLLNIVYLAIFSAPTPFQKFAFEQPNVAVFYFPFMLLPGCVVPLVLFSHLAAIRNLLRNKDWNVQGKY